MRLTADGARGWGLTLGPIGTRHDYLWVVSPPFQTAPHLWIGAGYNVSAARSAQLSPRHVRFVTSAREYEDAAELAERATRDAGSGITAADIKQQGKGSLDLTITAYGIAPTDALAWIRVSGRACQPRPPVPPELSAPLSVEELQVIVAALDATALREARRFAPARRRGASVAVIPDSTLAWCQDPLPQFCISPISRSSIARLLGESSGLAHAFTSRNSHPLPVRLSGEGVTIAPVSELGAMFQSGVEGWQEFNRHFGRVALVTFSAPAIHGDQAAIYVTSGCGGLCGKIWLVTLERRNGVFRVRASHVLAVA